VAALVVASASSAEAGWRRHHVWVGPFGLVGAVVGTAAAVATAPIAIIAGATAPRAYGPPPGYDSEPPPGYYNAPPQGYYGQQGGYGPPQGYAPPPQAYAPQGYGPGYGAPQQGYGPPQGYYGQAPQGQPPQGYAPGN
jgi:hypothetical protein